MTFIRVISIYRSGVTIWHWIVGFGNKTENWEDTKKTRQKSRQVDEKKNVQLINGMASCMM